MASETSIMQEGKVIIFPGAENVEFSTSELKDQKVRDWLVTVAWQRICREATAGKTESAEDRAKAIARCKERFAALQNGQIERARGEALKLTAEEEAGVIWGFILGRKRLAGDKRSERELKEAWNKLDEAKRAAILEKNKKPIAKALRAALQAKKKPGETDF